MSFLLPSSLEILVTLFFSHRLPDQVLWIIDGSPADHRENGPQLRKVVDRAGDRVRPKSHEVSELSRLECATPMALTVELRSGSRVQLHRRILVDGILGSLNASF